ncbi:zf-HC2 domain-containing protein [Mycobacterium sp. 141]|uniref:zf-HC2 domain-containing protein n=1 Tax=Mycobacterium sp. 141 TaxID=1120797 RepID=UPI0003782058|nr:zf-HC2 domain-containing protein [Mycobacterium sp. 141]
MIDEPHVLLGAYILGGLDAEERGRFEVHLKECAQCRAEAAGFAPLPALLSKIDPADLDTEPDDGRALLDMLAARRAAATRRRRRRRRVAVAACAAVLAALALVLVIPRGTTTPAGTGTFAMHSVIAAGASGSVTLTPKPWGTAIVLDLKQLPAAGVFTLRTMDDSGQMQPAATWAAMPTGAGIVQGATSIPMPKLRKLNIVDADDTVLATVER